MGEGLSRALKRAFRAFATFVLSAIARVKFNARVTGDSDELRDTAVILCNHTSVWDFAYLLLAAGKKRVRFVATSIEFEKNRLYAWTLGALGAIKKKQGAPDAACVRNMVLAARAGDIVALYPAGMTSFDGRPAWRAQPGTGKLVKLMGVSVYAALVNGGFLSHPRYARASYRGRVDVRLKRLYTPEELKGVTAEQAQNTIERALEFNDWDWLKRENARFPKGDRVKGLNKLIYMCPKCAAEGEMTELKRGLKCAACNMTARLDTRGYLRFDSVEKRVDECVDAQLSALKAEMSGAEFCLRARVKLTRPSASGYAPTDEGELRLSRAGLAFKGAGELKWTFSEFQYFMLNDVDYLHIYALNGAYRFVFFDPRLIYKWFFAHRLMAN